MPHRQAQQVETQDLQDSSEQLLHELHAPSSAQCRARAPGPIGPLKGIGGEHLRTLIKFLIAEHFSDSALYLHLEGLAKGDYFLRRD